MEWRSKTGSEKSLGRFDKIPYTGFNFCEVMLYFSYKNLFSHESKQKLSFFVLFSSFIDWLQWKKGETLVLFQYETLLLSLIEEDPVIIYIVSVSQRRGKPNQ